MGSWMPLFHMHIDSIRVHIARGVHDVYRVMTHQESWTHTIYIPSKTEGEFYRNLLEHGYFSETQAQKIARHVGHHLHTMP